MRAVDSRAGFVHDGFTEIVMIAQVERVARCVRSALVGLRSKRTAGVNSVRISACRDEEVLGYIELDTDPADGGRLGQLG